MAEDTADYVGYSGGGTSGGDVNSFTPFEPY